MARRTQGTIYWRGGKVWISFQVAGRRRWEPTDAENTTQARVIVQRRILEELEKAGMPGSPAKPSPVKSSIGDLLIAWRNEKNPRTTDFRRVERFADWVGRPQRPDDTTPQIVSEWLRLRLRTLKPSTVNREAAAISAFFKWIVRNGAAKSNPVRDAEKPSSSYRPPEALLTTEMESVLKAIEGHPVLEPAYLMALYAGLRRGEIAAARWEHVDIERRTIIVPQGKTVSSMAALPLLGPLEKWLIAHRQSSGPIIPGRRGRGIEPNGLSLAIRAWNADVGIESHEIGSKAPKNCVGTPEFRPWVNVRDGVKIPRPLQLPNLHRCRHTACTLLLRSGVSAHIASRFMRHSNSRVTEAIYGHHQAIDFRSQLSQVLS